MGAHMVLGLQMDRSMMADAGATGKYRGTNEPSNEARVEYSSNTALLGTDVISGTAKCEWRNAWTAVARLTLALLAGVVVNVGNHTEWVKQMYPDRKNN